MSISESRPSDEPTGAVTAGTNGTLLELRKITKTFGPVRALTDVDLQIPAGKVTALVGDNGAGKSSLIKTVSGLWGPDGGEILWEGRPRHPHDLPGPRPVRQPGHRPEHVPRPRTAAPRNARRPQDGDHCPRHPAGAE